MKHASALHGGAPAPGPSPAPTAGSAAAAAAGGADEDDDEGDIFGDAGTDYEAALPESKPAAARWGVVFLGGGAWDAPTQQAGGHLHSCFPASPLPPP
jgi:hypothetical protein